MKYDVVVVGAGPAGSTAAKFLSEKGIKVLLIDKSKFPRNKLCGGGLTSRVLDRFDYVKNKDLIESYSYGGFSYSSSLKYKVIYKKNNPVAAMVLREKFDMGLARLAVESGADFIDGRTVKDAKFSNEKAKIILDDRKEVDSEIVVGADGIWSIIAKKSGLAPPLRNLGICVLHEYDVDEEIIDENFGKEKMCYIHLQFRGIPGYGWVFPKKQHINIGIGKISPDAHISKTKTDLLAVYKDYIKMLKKKKIIPKNLEIRQCKGAALHIGPIEKTYADRVLLCGDASGFINPLTGEGVYYAMSSGEIAAKVIAEALELGDTSGRFLSRYQENWKKDFGKDIELLSSLTKNTAEQIEKIVKFASKDEKLANIALGILHGGLNIQDYRLELILRYLYASVKDRFIIV
jgi:geranylgeranyl reductase family protein